MLLKKFYINIIFRILGILANCIVIAIFLAARPDWLITANLLFLLGLQVLLLLLKLNKLNKDLESFFSAMRSSDSSIVFSGMKKNSPFKTLYQQLEEINKDFQKLKIENYRQTEYFKVLVEHVNIGLISYNDKDEITLYNCAAKELLGKRYLHKIEELEQILPGLTQTVKEIEPSHQKLITIYNKNEVSQLSVRVAIVKFEMNWIKLISFQNIRNELDEKELESWQKLIRVLTHELMNSAGPINSTIATIKEFLVNPDGETKKLDSLTNHIIDDTIEGLKIIEERSSGMMDFVKKFRSLTLLPKPIFSTIPVLELFKSIQRLMSNQFNNQKIEVEIKVSPSSLTTVVDKGMMEQILLNLISNAINALNDSPGKKIVLSASTDEIQRTIIHVIDNGCGIPVDIQDKVFVPFFTTRKDGSGIGLSLSRQLIRLQGGTLTFKSKENEGTVFTIKL
ncbi:MAG: sensor histidine kinase [Bacteroidales bacterium]|nr:MAG: sensor histidine kinase [Bacteroidales bacterium]